MNDKFFKTLKSILGEQFIKTNRQDLNYYGSDWTEEYIPNPLVIVFPKKISQVIKIVKIFCENFLDKKIFEKIININVAKR